MRLDMAYDGLEASFANVKFTGTVGADAACQEVLFGALALYGLDQVDKAEKYWLSFNKRQIHKALKAIIRTHFSNPTWEPNDL